MQRRTFLRNTLIATTGMLTLNDFEIAASSLKGEAAKMPVLFVGHGSPMNAIEENNFTKSWKSLGKTLPVPKAILCVSAHWTTQSTFVTAMEKPETIHDFYGFPQELFNVQYPAPGSKEFADETCKLFVNDLVKPSNDWGLDHGCWSVLLPMYPNADIPVFQMSLDLSKPPSYHYGIGQQLKKLRQRGILIIGSGNIVHNLGMLQWNNKSYDWALEFDAWSKDRIEAGDDQAMINYHTKGQLAKLAIPTNEHYLPLLYTLALREKDEEISFFNDQTVMGSISMRSVKIG